MDLKTGAKVTDNVRLVRPLAGGAMGSVWVGHHTTLQTEVAVKFIAAELSQDPDVLRRFTWEASASAKIKSPHIVKCFDQGRTQDGTPFIVMELVEGSSLAAKLDAEGPLSLRDTSIVVAQVSRALRAAHRANIVHRDIKPENILVTTVDDELFCKVLDFGIARRLDKSKAARFTKPNMLIGTPEYMSRDLIAGLGEIDYRADLWSLAVVAYECLTGALPFDGRTLGLICSKIMFGEFVPPSQLDQRIPREFDEWFARALHQDPKQRFPDAKAVARSFLDVAVRSQRAFDTGEWEAMLDSVIMPSPLPYGSSHPPPNSSRGLADSSGSWPGGFGSQPNMARPGSWPSGFGSHTPTEPPSGSWPSAGWSGPPHSSPLPPPSALATLPAPNASVGPNGRASLAITTALVLCALVVGVLVGATGMFAFGPERENVLAPIGANRTIAPTPCASE